MRARMGKCGDWSLVWTNMDSRQEQPSSVKGCTKNPSFSHVYYISTVILLTAKKYPSSLQQIEGF
jgi:hypothetical protein